MAVRFANIPLKCFAAIWVLFRKKRFFSVKQFEKTSRLALQKQHQRICWKQPKRRISGVSSKNFPKALKRWLVSAALLFRVDRSSGPPSLELCCAVQLS